MGGFVYIIVCDGLYKIGCAKDPQRRLAQLQTATPHELALVKFYPVRKMDKAEAFLQKKFLRKRVRGEWFALSVTELEWLSEIPDLDMVVASAYTYPLTKDEVALIRSMLRARKTQTEIIRVIWGVSGGRNYQKADEHLRAVLADLVG